MIRILDTSVPLRALGLRITEMLLVFAALLLAWRASSGQHLNWTAATYGQVCLIGLLFLLCMYCLDLYEPQVTTDQEQSLSRILQAIGLTISIFGALTWLWPRVEVLPVLFGMVLLGAALSSSRYAFAELADRPTLAQSTVVWGSGPLAESLVGEINRRPDVGIRLLGIVEHGYAGETFAGIRYLGSPDLIWDLAETGQARQIIVAVNERRGCLPVEKLMALKAAGMSVEDGSELYEELTGKVWLGAFSTSSLLFSRRFRKCTLRVFLDRGFAALCAVVTLIILSPVLLITALLIRLDSDGPAILRQVRVGENGRYFTLFKFRSMKVGAECESALAPATHDDPRCTRVGRWIRRFRLDELPQLFNILKGDMSFVGPRPFVPDQEYALVQHIPNYRQRWAIRPGLTGWAQVHRGYCASIEDNADKLSYDLFYIKNRSMALDLLTLLKTLKIFLLGRGGR